MQTSARFQAVLDLVTAVLADKQPADGIINEYLRPGNILVQKTAVLLPTGCGKSCATV